MSASTLERQTIPDTLIYEMVDGSPIYYLGYQEVLAGEKTLEEIMSDGNIQAWLKTQIAALLTYQLASQWVVTSGEHGLQFRKKSWRAADIAIFKPENFEFVNTYSQKAPEIVVEIDTKADLDSFGDAINYYDEKTNQLFEFGVKKVIWILTDSKKIKVLTPTERPATLEWNTDILIIENISINIQELIDKAPFNK
ncbi:MAG: Uma2 family endonuclease [Lewinellaceae bacterium]|nr:hypothetical protein [Phaeodactylibacter sp.]MCB0613460.1 hypothetical protein [Phaeodactylibacter sp.]MCB9348917.1 Uma2 family endonuclease [Lewinellaceae bacterium]